MNNDQNAQNRKSNIIVLNGDADYAFASYIVGCLIVSGAIPSNPNIDCLDQDISIAVRVVTACLKQLPPKGDWPSLPFDF